MRVFTSIGTVCLKNIGVLEAVELPEEIERNKLLSWLGQEVEIDGRIQKVYGVESHCIITLRKGDTIGILVKSWRNE